MIIFLWFSDHDGRLSMSPSRRLLVEHLEKQNTATEEIVQEDADD